MTKKKAKEGFDMAALMARKRIERERDGVRERRVHHSVLGPGWMSAGPGPLVFTADDGRTLDLTKWERIGISRLPKLFNDRLKRTAEDFDYQSILLEDGTAHEFKLEFAP